MILYKERIELQTIKLPEKCKQLVIYYKEFHSFTDI